MMTLIKYTSIIISFIAIAISCSVLIDCVKMRENEYELKRMVHVLSVWDGHNNPVNHTCEYGDEWCNPNYAEWLRNHNK